jgi:hypothetical protein
MTTGSPRQSCVAVAPQALLVLPDEEPEEPADDQPDTAPRGIPMSNAAPSSPSAQSQADIAEKEALARYLALRALWSPCWGVPRRDVPGRRRP